MRGQGDPPRGCAELRIDAFFYTAAAENAKTAC